MESLRKLRQEYQDSWAKAEFVNDPAQNAIAIGYCKCLDDTLNISYSEIVNAE